MEASCDPQPYALNRAHSASVVIGGLILRLKADAYTPYTFFGLVHILEDSCPYTWGQYFTASGQRPAAVGT
jgi:hypothetical protein